MAKNLNLPKELSDLLEKILNENLENFEVQQHAGNKKGEGYLGELLFISLKNKTKNKELHFAIKQILECTHEATLNFMCDSYINEINFYKVVLPALQSFQKSSGIKNIFDNTPKYYGAVCERSKEKLVLENIKFQNYELHPRKELVSKEMFENIFKTYSKLHAISFAFKHRKPDEFNKFKDIFKLNWLSIGDLMISKAIEHSRDRIVKVLENYGEDNLATKFKKYMENGIERFKEAVRNTDGVIIHGDSWSNNMMFKYNQSRQIEDIKFLDFQLACIGSPTRDLCYSFYAGAPKELLDDLNIFLKLYHDSLRIELKEYGIDVEQVYTFTRLKEEWKKYVAFGFIMGFLVWGAKNMDESCIPDLTKFMEEDLNQNGMDFKINKENYDGPICDLVRHMCDNDFI